MSWERLRLYGRLPLFSVSLTALVLIPIFFFFLALFNEQIGSWKSRVGALLPGGQLEIVPRLVEQLQPLTLPALSFWLLISTLFLGIALNRPGIVGGSNS